MQQPYDVFNEITAVSTYSKAWDILKRFFPDLLLIVLLLMVFQIPAGAFAEKDEGFNWFTPLYWLLILGPVSFSLAFATLQVVRENRFKLDPAFDVFKKNYFNLLLANLLQSVIVGIGMVFLIVPGIIFAVRLAFVPYLVTEKSMDAVEAVKASWKMTGPYAWRIFFMGLLAIPIAIGGLILLGVGIIISVMWISAAFAMIYHLVSKERENQTGEDVVQEE